MSFFISDAYAQQAGQEGDPMSLIIMMVIFFALLYFMMIRPQTKRAREHKKMCDALTKGDEVVTGGGVLGKITEVADDLVTVEVAEGVNVKLQRHAVVAVLPKGTLKSV